MQVERQLQILALLAEEGVAQIAQLSRRFGVSRNTIRRDLKQLEDEGLVMLAHGGAVSRQYPPMGVPIQMRQDQFGKEKQRIGERAAVLVHDGDAIIIDSGTTTERMIPSLKGKTGITVITNGINIALVGTPGINTVLSGGILNETTISTAGFHAESFIAQFHVRTAFIGAGGVTLDGVSNTNAFEVQIKRAMIECADVVVFLATHDKIGNVSIAPLAPLSAIDLIITDDKADSREVEAYRERGVEVILC